MFFFFFFKFDWVFRTLQKTLKQYNFLKTLSLIKDGGASTITSNLRKLNEVENKIDAEIDDLAQY